jgi:hypothetical protein
MTLHNCTQVDRIARIERTVDEIGEKVSQIATSVDVLVVKLAPVIDKVQDHDRALRGSNGDPGIVGEVSDIGKTIREWADNQKWLFRLIIGWLVTTALGSLYFIVTNSPKLP